MNTIYITQPMYKNNICNIAILLKQYIKHIHGIKTIYVT